MSFLFARPYHRLEQQRQWPEGLEESARASITKAEDRSQKKQGNWNYKGNGGNCSLSCAEVVLSNEEERE